MKDPIVEEVGKYRMEHTRKFGGVKEDYFAVLYLADQIPWVRIRSLSVLSPGKMVAAMRPTRRQGPGSKTRSRPCVA